MVIYVRLAYIIDYGHTHVINPSNKNVYIVGDFNIDLLKHNDHFSTNEFIDTIYGYSLIPSITRPTRVTSRTSTLIDNILCSLAEHKQNVFKGILSTDISDHCPVFFIDPTHTDHVPPAHCTRRDMSPGNLAKFKDKLAHFNWSVVYSNQDPKCAFDLIYNYYLDLYGT